MKPEGSRPGHSPSPAPGDTAPHPAEASLWEQFMSRGNLAEALRRVEQNAGAAGIDGMSTEGAAAVVIAIGRRSAQRLTRAPTVRSPSAG